jgi:hypothetical protein
MYLFEPFQTPITQWMWFQNSNNYTVGNPKFELMEDTLVPHTDTLTVAVAGGGTTENLTVTDYRLYQLGTLIHQPLNQETYRVTATPSSTTVAVAKVGSGNITACAAGVVILSSGAYSEGSAAAIAVSTISTFPYNYCQIDKEAINLTNTQKNTDNYGGDDWTNQQAKALKQIKLKIERSALFGRRFLIASSSSVKGTRMTGGLFDSDVGVTDYSQYTGYECDETFFFKTFLPALYAKGTNVKKMYCGIDLMLQINDYSKAKQFTNVVEKEYGVDITKIKHPQGVLELQWHPMFEREYSYWGLALDRGDYIKHVTLKNRGLQYEENLTIGTDEKKDQYIIEHGWHIAGAGQGVHRQIKPGA